MTTVTVSQPAYPLVFVVLAPEAPRYYSFQLIVECYAVAAVCLYNILKFNGFKGISVFLCAVGHASPPSVCGGPSRPFRSCALALRRMKNARISVYHSLMHSIQYTAKYSDLDSGSSFGRCIAVCACVMCDAWRCVHPTRRARFEVGGLSPPVWDGAQGIRQKACRAAGHCCTAGNGDALDFLALLKHTIREIYCSHRAWRNEAWLAEWYCRIVVCACAYVYSMGKNKNKTRSMNF